MRAISAGVAYFAIAFALGFALGTLRVVVVEPRTGAVAATLVELPLMLAASWVACGWTIARLRVPPGLASRAVMGTVAFALLMLAETLLGVLAFGRTLAQQRAAVASPPGLLGLGAQVLFALMPLVRRRGASQDRIGPSS